MVRSLARHLVAFGIVALVTLTATAQSPHAPESGSTVVDRGSTDLPNIIVLLADDMGVNDASHMGNKTILTPNIDQLASQGIRFSHFRVASSTCSPSRAAMLTGRYPQRLGITRALGWNDEQGLAQEEITIGEHLQRNAGYVSGFVGKWHVGDQEYNLPWARGYDSSACLLWGQAKTYFNPSFWSRDGKETVDGFLTDIITDAAIDFIDKSRDEPFFLWVSFQAPHDPQQAPRERIQSALSRQPPDRREPYRTNNAIHNAMMEGLDAGVGRILEKLRQLQMDDNTIVIFTSDNGAVDWQSKNGSFLSGKGSMFEGGFRVPFIVRWPNGVSGGSVSDAEVNALDLFPTLCRLAQVEPPDVLLDGRDVSPAFQGIDLPPRSSPFFAWENREGEYTGRAVWWRNWKYMSIPEWEGLFDLNLNEHKQFQKTYSDLNEFLQFAFEDFKHAVKTGNAVRSYPNANDADAGN